MEFPSGDMFLESERNKFKDFGFANLTRPHLTKRTKTIKMTLLSHFVVAPSISSVSIHNKGNMARYRTNSEDGENPQLDCIPPLTQ
jgi:hypothetical protein